MSLLAMPAVASESSTPKDLFKSGQLRLAGADEGFPARRSELDAWLAGRPAAGSISIFGGAYWLRARVTHDGPPGEWVLDASNTLIERVDARLYGDDGSVQEVTTGYLAPHEYALHYGKRVALSPGVTYDILLRFSSPYYASVPRFSLVDAASYENLVARENIIALAAIGAMVALGLFNLFVFMLVRARSHLYYAGQMLLGAWGWAATFHVLADGFGIHDLRLHYVPFFLVAAVGSLFCTAFLELKERQPLMHRAFLVVVWVSLALTPLAVFALPYAHAVATLVISAWINLALIAGVRSLMSGYRPARFFVLAFVALLLPAIVILPANVDLIPDLVDNAELLTLVGGAVEGLLQAFALADRIRIISSEKQSYLTQLVEALHVAQTDVLTGIGNRFAFGRSLQEHVEARRRGDAQPLILVVIDLDGLKSVNDEHGHERGDELIKTLARGLIELTEAGGSCFRLGGDEFALIAPAADELRVCHSLARLEIELHSRGFEQSGISYGIAHWHVGMDDPAQAVRLADQAMYRHKVSRKRGRPVDVPLAS